MRDTNKVSELLKTNYRKILLCLVIGSIPLTINVGNMALILSFAVALFLIIRGTTNRKSFLSFTLLFPLLFFLLILISGLTSSDLHSGLKQIDKALLYPLIVGSLYALNSSSRRFLRILLLFFVALTLISTLLFIFSGALAVLQGSSLEVLYFHEFGSLFDQHPVYFGLYLALSIFILTHYFFKGNDQKGYRLLSYIVSIAVLLVGINFTASKAIIIMFLILFLVQLMLHLKSNLIRVVIVLAIVGSSVTVLNSDFMSSRFREGLSFNIEQFEPTTQLEKAKVFSNGEKELISDLELRYLFIKIGLYHTITDNKALFGYGIGDIQHHMDYYYMTYGLAPGWFEGFNLHNQYLQLFASMGVFVLLFFLCYLGYSIYHAVLTKNELHILFLILITFVFLFECLLSRNKGIVFFIFFNTLFLINGKLNEVSNSRH